jgi:hypothetical protein
MPRKSAIFLILCLLRFGCKKQETIQYPSVFNLSLSSEATTIANVLVEHDGDASVEYYLVCLREKGKDYSDAELIHLAKEDLSAGAKRRKGNKRIVSFDGLIVDSRYVVAAVLTGSDGNVFNDKLAARLDFETGTSYNINVTVTGRSKTSLDVKVESDADRPWFIFASSDFGTDDIQSLITKEYSGKDYSGQMHIGSKTVTIDGLQPGWRYRVIAAYEPGNGHFFNYEMEKARTDWDPVPATDWEISYVGMQKEEGKDVAGVAFSISVPEGETIAASLLMSIAFEYNNDLKYWLESVVDNDYFLLDYGPVANFGPVEQTEWFLIVVGTEGVSYNLSGKYYKSAPIHVDYGGALESYDKWLGKWSVGDDKVRFNLWIEQGNINYEYIAYGWENFADEFPIRFDPGTGDLKFLASVTMPDHIDDNNVLMDIAFSGLYYDRLDKAYYTFGKGGYLAEAKLIDENKASISPCTTDFSDGEDYYLSTMQFIGYPKGDNYHYFHWSDPDEVPHFPMTMERLEGKANEKKMFRPLGGFDSRRPSLACTKQAKER